MRLQFSTSAILSAVAFAGVTFGGYLAVWKHLVLLDPNQTTFNLFGAIVVVSPYWTPLLFASYALGRKKLTGGIVVVFAMFEIAAIGCSTLTLQMWK